MGKKSKSKKGLKAQVVAASSVAPITNRVLLDQDLAILEQGMPRVIEGLTASLGSAAVKLLVCLLHGGQSEAMQYCTVVALGVCVVGATVSFFFSRRKRMEYQAALDRMRIAVATGQSANRSGLLAALS